jgi:hypothetical protein
MTVKASNICEVSIGTVDTDTEEIRRIRPKPSIGVLRSRYSMANIDTFGSETTDPANKGGRMVRRLIIFAPSLLHETAPYLLAVEAMKMGLKITESRFGGVFGGPWTLTLWRADGPSSSSSSPNQSRAIASNIIQHAAIFCCVPLHRPVETWAISRHIQHAATKGLRARSTA